MKCGWSSVTTVTEEVGSAEATSVWSVERLSITTVTEEVGSAGATAVLSVERSSVTTPREVECHNSYWGSAVTVSALHSVSPACRGLPPSFPPSKTAPYTEPQFCERCSDPRKSCANWSGAMVANMEWLWLVGQHWVTTMVWCICYKLSEAGRGWSSPLLTSIIRYSSKDTLPCMIAKYLIKQFVSAVIWIVYLSIPVRNKPFTFQKCAKNALFRSRKTAKNGRLESN